MTDKTVPMNALGSGQPASKPPGRSVPLSAGTMLDGRFVIVELLGTGGMGEVYEAEDQVLNESVAVKIVHPEVATDQDAFSRFCREVKLARRISHPNICRVYDLFCHAVPDGADFSFVSMELLPGKSLGEILAVEGALPLEKALNLIRQMASGLQAAHRLGILHRDLKPSNVMLVREASGLRASITDFGLACIHDRPTDDPSLTTTGELLGTPAYMSPEQVQGETLSAATDIYSLGVIMYEMLSGTRPFVGKNAFHVAMNRLTQPPRPLQPLRPDLPPEVVTLVERCLIVDPTARSCDSAEIIKTIESIEAELETASGLTQGAAPKAPFSEASVPILPTPQGDSNGSHLPTKQIPNRLQLALVAATVALLLVGGVLTWKLNTHRSSGVDDGSPAVNSAESPIPRLEERVASLLKGQLQEMEVVTGVGTVPSETSDPQSLQIADDHLAVYDGLAALAVVDEALTKYPDDPYLLFRRAEALWRLGRDPEALEAASRTVALSGGLGAQKPPRFDSLYYGLKGDWQRASETLQNHTALGITDIEIGLFLIEANWLLGHNNPWADLFTALHKLPEAANEGRITLWQSRVAHSQGDYDRQENLARTLVADIDTQQQPFLALEARMELAEALGRLGRLQEAEPEVARIVELAEEADVPLYTAHALKVEGRLLKRQGRSAQATTKLQEAATLYQQMGSKWGSCLSYKLLGYSSSANLFRNPSAAIEATIAGDQKGVEVCNRGGFREKEALVKLNLGQAYRDRGDFEEALLLFQESTELLDGLGNNRHQAMTRLNLALLLGRLGRVDETLAALQASEAWQRQLSDAGELAKILVVRAWGLISAGRLKDAEAAIAEAQTLPGADARRIDLLELQGEVAWAVGEAELLHTISKELETLATTLGRDEGVQIAHRLAAQAIILDGRIEEGLERLSNVGTARAKLTRAEVLWDHGQTEAAATVLETSRDAITALEERFKDWRLEILDALIEASRQGELAESLSRLRAVEHAAVRKGHLHAAVRARLSIGWLEKDVSMLRAVEAECRRYGFLQLAHRARQWRERIDSPT